MNFIEKFVIKRFAKKLVKKLPDIKQKIEKEGKKIFEKYVKQIEEHSEELYNKVQIAILQVIEKYENKSK